MRILTYVAVMLAATAWSALGEIGAQEKKIYDFVVPRDGSFRDAIDKANGRSDTTQRFRIFVMSGNHTIPVCGKTIGRDGKEYDDPRTRLSTPNVSIIGESRDMTVLSNITPPALWDNGSRMTCPIEGIGRGDVLIIDSAAVNTYIQDLTMKSGMDDHTGRNIVLDDCSDKTIAKNVCLWGYQDTYVSKNPEGRYYFDGGVIRGRTDYICGKGDVYYDKVTFQQYGKGGYIAVPSVPRKYGYVMDSCYVRNESDDVTYYLGRAWGKGTPIAVWINTTVDVSPITEGEHNGWADMSSKGWPARFAEYNTMLKSGEALSLEGRRSTFVDKEGVAHNNNPVLTAEEASTYTIDRVFEGWNPKEYTIQAVLPRDVRVENGCICWTGSDDAIMYAVCRDGKVVDFTTETIYKPDVDTAGHIWAVRAANRMGGLGEAVQAR